VPEMLPYQCGEWSSNYLTLICWNSLTVWRKVLPQASVRKIDTLNPSDTLVNFYQSTHSYILEDRNFQARLEEPKISKNQFYCCTVHYGIYYCSLTNKCTFYYTWKSL